jgi:hypothetical protein
MTPMELQTALKGIRAMLPEKGSVYLHAGGDEYSGKPCISVQPFGYDDRASRFSVEADTWEEMIEQARARVLAADWSVPIIRKLALSIIELTDEHGACAELNLRQKGHSQQEITLYGDAAVAKAKEMGARDFAIVRNVSAEDAA